MKIKELLLNGNSFSMLMKQFAMKAEDIKIQDEDMILYTLIKEKQQTHKEHICIEGTNTEGIINFFGTLHYNSPDQLAVFELQGYDKVTHTH
jgi:hypothetical protein